MRDLIRARDLLAAEVASQRVGFDAIISYINARCTGNSDAISLWRETIPSDWNGNTHINESRFVKLLRHRDIDSLFKNIKTGIDLIEHYTKKTPSPDKLIDFVESVSSGDEELIRKKCLFFSEIFFAGSNPHGNVGNSNASKGLDSHLNIRVSKESKAGWVKQAQRENLSLTDWANKKLNLSVDDDLRR